MRLHQLWTKQASLKCSKPLPNIERSLHLLWSSLLSELQLSNSLTRLSAWTHLVKCSMKELMMKFIQHMLTVLTQSTAISFRTPSTSRFKLKFKLMISIANLVRTYSSLSRRPWKILTTEWSIYREIKKKLKSLMMPLIMIEHRKKLMIKRWQN